MRREKAKNTAEFIMLTSLLQAILINVFNRLRGGLRLPVHAANKPKEALSDKAFIVGRILPSLLAPVQDRLTNLNVDHQGIRTHNWYALGNAEVVKLP